MPAWNEKYKRRISMLDDMRGLANSALKFLGYSINTTDPKQIEEAKQLLIKQKRLVKVYTSDMYIDLLKSGDIWLSQGYSGDVFQVMKENKAMKYVIPKEGSDIWVDNMCIPRGARSKYTAEVFINYLLRPEVGAEISDFTWYAAAPIATKTLADYGAEVIRIEGTSRPDGHRLLPPFKDGIPGWNRGGGFNQANSGKLSVTLNLAPYCRLA